jgi:hypothetical protein
MNPFRKFFKKLDPVSTGTPAVGNTYSHPVYDGFPVGTPVIHISNEWEDMSVGIITSVDYSRGGPVVQMTDYSRKELRDIIFIGLPIKYTDERFAILAKMNPAERWAMRCLNSTCASSIVDKDNGANLMEAYQYAVHLINNGFIKIVHNLEKKG